MNCQSQIAQNSDQVLSGGYPFGTNCALWSSTSPLYPATCDPVQAFINVRPYLGRGGGLPFPPIFLRVYWAAAVPSGFDSVAFEWSATGEYIDWYINNIRGTGADISLTVTNSGGTFNPGEILVPLLKVTNHSPSSF